MEYPSLTEEEATVEEVLMPKEVLQLEEEVLGVDTVQDTSDQVTEEEVFITEEGLKHQVDLLQEVVAFPEEEVEEDITEVDLKMVLESRCFLINSSPEIVDLIGGHRNLFLCLIFILKFVMFNC